MSAEVISAHPNLKLIANVAVGYDNIDVDSATRELVLVLNTPGVLDETTADLAFGLLIACARRIAEGDRYVRARQWTGWSPELMLGVDLHDKTLGLVGMGRIGSAVARRARGFNMKVLYTRRNPSADAGGGPKDAKQATLEEVLSTCDFVSLHCPLNKETYHLIGERELAVMKPGAILVNTSRGAVVDQAALARALESGHLRAAGLDVFENEPDVPDELLKLPNVVLTPHVGSASIETRAAMARLACQGAIEAFSGKLPSNAVNPQVWNSFSARIK